MTGETDTETGVASNEAVVVFDGVCNLCHGLVSFLLPQDPEGNSSSLRYSPTRDRNS